MLIAFAGLGLWAAFTKVNYRHRRKDIAAFMATGMIIAAHWILFFEAIKLSNVSITLAALSSTSLFVALFEPLLYRRKLDVAEVFFGLCVMGGLLLILNVEQGAFIGIVLGVVSAMLAALFGTINGLFVRNHPPASITFWEMIGGVIAASAFLLATGEFDKAFFTLSAADWGWLALLGLVCTSFAFPASVRVMKKLSPFTVALAINLEPVYGVLLALLFFPATEQMTPGFYLGACIILATIFANTLWKRYQRKKTAKAG